jgi:hypothetical protein
VKLSTVRWNADTDDSKTFDNAREEVNIPVFKGVSVAIKYKNPSGGSEL